MIIFDEYLHGEMIDKRNFVDENHLVSECGYLGRYLLECGNSEDKVRDRLREILLNSGIYDYRSTIENTIKKSMRIAKSRKCKKFLELIFYKKEIDKIKSFNSLDIQKIAFGYLVLSKFYNSYVTAKKTDIMEMVDVKCSGARFRQILNILTNSDFMTIKHEIKNYKETKSKTIKSAYRVNKITDEDEVVLVIKDFKNILGGFMEQIGNPVFRCNRCGGLFEKNSWNSRFCKICKKQNKSEKDRERYKKSKTNFSPSEDRI